MSSVHQQKQDGLVSSLGPAGPASLLMEAATATYTSLLSGLDTVATYWNNRLFDACMACGSRPELPLQLK
jgi:hypothetical protein